MRFSLLVVLLVAAGCNASPSFEPIATAPRDGTVIETMDVLGTFRPWYGLFKWDAKEKAFVQADYDPERDADYAFLDISDPRTFRWRPYAGRIEDYVDPTYGAQCFASYWGARDDYVVHKTPHMGCR